MFYDLLFLKARLILEQLIRHFAETGSKLYPYLQTHLLFYLLSHNKFLHDELEGLQIYDDGQLHIDLVYERDYGHYTIIYTFLRASHK